jgi:hypothetical protein
MLPILVIAEGVQVVFCDSRRIGKKLFEHLKSSDDPLWKLRKN